MPEQLHVDPDALRAAAAEVVAAVSGLEGARRALEQAGELVRSGIDHDGRADDKVATFVRQWRAECEIIGQLLDGFRAVLTEAASCYEQVEDALVGVVEGMVVEGAAGD